jgi:hypothetical protein
LRHEPGWDDAAAAAGEPVRVFLLLPGRLRLLLLLLLDLLADCDLLSSRYLLAGPSS